MSEAEKRRKGKWSNCVKTCEDYREGGVEGKVVRLEQSISYWGGNREEEERDVCVRGHDEYTWRRREEMTGEKE